MKNRFLILAAFVYQFSSCKKEKENPPAPSITPEMKKEVVENYATIVHASYEDSYLKALELQQKTEQFFSAPSQANFDAVKAAYLSARIPYEQTEAYRFYGGPIDDDNGPEGLLNSWPLNEAYIDYIKEDTQSTGIINKKVDYPTINKELLESLNGLNEDENVSAGYHAIEFLLWGQDFSSNGPGNRPYLDYVSGPAGTAYNQDRRRAYLKAAIELLVENLKYLVDAWKPGVNGNYRETFVAKPDSALKLLLSGAAEFAKGELAGERMTPAYTLQDQEEEHSCFSDNTHNDILFGQRGIYNVYIGRYARTNGTIIDGLGIDDLVKVHRPDLNTAMIKLLDEATEAAYNIEEPFDQEINDGNPGGRARVLTAINAIKAEADKLVEAAASLGITF